MMKRRRFLTLTAAFACAPHLAQASTWRGTALGADVSVTLSGPRNVVAATLGDIPHWLNHFEDIFSLYRSDSVLTRLNANGQATVPAPMSAVFDKVTLAHRLTDGLFDPTVQPLYEALARSSDVAAARRLIGWDRVTRHAGGLVRLDQGQKLTLNGIAQGAATDMVRARLTAAGFDKALVNIGEHAALGGPYTLGLSDPSHLHLGHITLTNETVATSSPSATHVNGHTHILSPAGQAPLWSTISIVGPDATLADALSTAAVFMPMSQLAQLKTKAGLTRILVVAPDGRVRTI